MEEEEADDFASRPAAAAAAATTTTTTTTNTNTYLNRSFTSSSSSSSSSSPGLLRQVQAAFKRHRPLGTMQSNSIKPRRMILPQRGTSRATGENAGHTGDARKDGGNVSKSDNYPSKDLISLRKNLQSIYGGTQEDASIVGTNTDTYNEQFHLTDVQRDPAKPYTGLASANAGYLSHNESEPVHAIDNPKKVQFLLRDNEHSREASTINNHDRRNRNLQYLEDINLRSDGGVSSLLEKRAAIVPDQLQRFGNFLSHAATQSSAAGPSCTSTLINSTSAPMFNSITSRSYRENNSHAVVESLGAHSNKAQSLNQGDIMHPPYPSTMYTAGITTGQTANAVEASTSVIESQVEVKEHGLNKEHQGSRPKESDSQKDSRLDGTNIVKESLADVTDAQSQAPLSQHSTLDLRSDPSKSVKQEKTVNSKGASVPRKRTYDPDLFFKVNGKLYQRLGKIGSGGSSEVHKVISADCTIYALKKIKLKGRDYATAYGFCQEILYLNKLKGKKNIIQLIDYEVTDKNLLQEVLTCTMSIKDSRVKDDGYIYMVLEYGEIDLAHMLSQKWKEMDSTNQSIDENWLRFYWQQILQAVNTIHEERVVHSDLKPANFLLVKGSLKLIDFGIAKAIMSDTTNIQRDSQVGTLSYMSPEAFMCNENDGNGNIIKCGRPSDIWSLGCILYQMVYGRTPFSDYKTFWAKFKVITDPTHEITYEPVSNPWLLDLMKNCLEWDRNKRWRIPELLQHPFLVPPVTSKLSSSPSPNCTMLQLIDKNCATDHEASRLYLQLQQLLSNTVTVESVEGQCKFLSQISELCFQLRQYLANSVQE